MNSSNPAPILTAVVLAAARFSAVHAETLQDALATAYRNNPTLQSQRYQQQGLDETYVQAKAGWRPTASGTGQAVYTREPNSIFSFNGGSSSASYGYGAISVTQPLYTGGRTTWAVRAAKASVEAGRQGLRSTESQVLLSAIQGYVDVLRDQQILAIRQSDMATLERQVAESSAKFTFGEVTKTDVSQAQAQLEAAKAALAAAIAQRDVSNAEFEAVIGEPPSQLAEPTTLPGVPESVDLAFELAEASNPMLLQSREQEKSSRARISEAKASYRPTIALQGTFGFIGPFSPIATRDYAQDVSGGVTVSVPILTGGLTASQIRQASAQNGSDRSAIEIARRQVVQSTSQAWSLLLSGRASTKAAEAQVAAAETALAGAQAEYGFGLRTTLDVLISDQNLRAAQLSLAVSRHDAFLAEAVVLQASGRLEINNLLPAEPAYDPASNFEKVKNTGALPWEAIVATVDEVGAP